MLQPRPSAGENLQAPDAALGRRRRRSQSRPSGVLPWLSRTLTSAPAARSNLRQLIHVSLPARGVRPGVQRPTCHSYLLHSNRPYSSARSLREVLSAPIDARIKEVMPYSSARYISPFSRPSLMICLRRSRRATTLSEQPRPIIAAVRLAFEVGSALAARSDSTYSDCS